MKNVGLTLELWSRQAGAAKDLLFNNSVITDHLGVVLLQVTDKLSAAACINPEWKILIAEKFFKSIFSP